MGRRWDIDERGHGVASASIAVPDLDRLRSAMELPDWVTEDPEHHLLPHVERSCGERGWTVTGWQVVDAVLEIDVVAPKGEGAHSPREVAFTLLGSFAEAATHVAEIRTDVGRDVELLVTTGMLEGQTTFEPHGHTVRLRARLA